MKTLSPLLSPTQDGQWVISDSHWRSGLVLTPFYFGMIQGIFLFKKISIHRMRGRGIGDRDYKMGHWTPIDKVRVQVGSPTNWTTKIDSPNQGILIFLQVRFGKLFKDTEVQIKHDTHVNNDPIQFCMSEMAFYSTQNMSLWDKDSQNWNNKCYQLKQDREKQILKSSPAQSLDNWWKKIQCVRMQDWEFWTQKLLFHCSHVCNAWWWGTINHQHSFSKSY